MCETLSSVHALLRCCMAALLAGAMAQLGCGGCPEVGCSSGVEVHYTTTDVGGASQVTVQACVAGNCRSSRRELVPGAHSVLLGIGDFTGKENVGVSVTIRDRTGRVLVRAQGQGPVVEFRPNGPNCPPPCYVVRVRVDGGRLDAVT